MPIKQITLLAVLLLLPCVFADTGAQTLEIMIDSPSAGQEFLRGDTVTIEAHVFVDGEISLSLDSINAYGFFGNIYLYDDGKHNDGKWKDGYYANDFEVETEQAAGKFSVFVSARQSTNYMLKKVEIEIKPELEAELETNSETYYLGDEIKFTGSLQRHGIPLEKSFELVISDAGTHEYKVPIETDTDGNFSMVFHTSLIDTAGNWTAEFNVTGDLNNIGSAKKSFEVKSPEDRSFLTIKLEGEPLLFYKRGNDLLLLAKVFDDLGNQIFDAELELETPLGEKIRFEKSDSNIFFVTMRIPVSMPYGEQDFFIRAKSSGRTGMQNGDLNFSLNIKEIGIRAEMLSPKIAQASVGETIIFRVRIYYENGEPLSEKIVPATVNNKVLVLSHEGTGIYSGEYIVKPEDSIIDFAIDFADPYHNKGTFAAQIDIEGTSLMYYLREYYLFFLAGFAMLLAIGWMLRKKINKRMNLRQLRKQAKFSEEMLVKTDQEYIAGHIPREEYNKITAKYKAETVKIRNKIRRMGAGKNVKK